MDTLKSGSGMSVPERDCLCTCGLVGTLHLKGAMLHNKYILPWNCVLLGPSFSDGPITHTSPEGNLVPLRII